MSEMIVSITEFGAVPNDGTLQTGAVQAAVDHCFLAGGGEVRIPEGTWVIGGVILRSNITLHLLEGAVLKGSRNPDDYQGYLADKITPLPKEWITDKLWNRNVSLWNPVILPEEDNEFYTIPGSRWNQAMLKAVNARNIRIIGEKGSVLDGSDCYDPLGEGDYRGPHAINLFYCDNVTFQGYTVKDSGNYAHSLFECTNITAEKVTALAGHDGIHFTRCDNVRILDCEFYTGDDCVAGFGNVNTIVRNCVLNSACSAFRFGGTNALIENCHIYGPCRYLFRGSLTKEERKTGIKPSLEGHRNNMLSAFTYFADYSVKIDEQPGNIIVRDCRIDYADRFLHYNYSGNERWQQNRPLESIRFENIQATDISMPLTAYGSADVPLRLTMKNIDISFRKGSEAVPLMHACNYERIELEQITLQNHCGDLLIKTWSDGEIVLRGIKCGLEENNWIREAEEPFICRPI